MPQARSGADNGRASWMSLLRQCVCGGGAGSQRSRSKETKAVAATAVGPRSSGASRDAVRCGQYRLVRQLGSGAYGEVFLASNGTKGDAVAVKRHTRSADGFKDFEASQRLSAALVGCGQPHPLIVRLLDHVIQGPERFTVMELCPYGDLEGLLLRLRPDSAFDEAEAAFYLLEVAEAVGHLHEAGVCHLDLRPCNVLLSRRGHCRLADFSICEVGVAATSDADGFSVRLSCRGRWLPPEILANRPSPAGRFTDWFSLGAMAAVLAGGPPALGGLSADFRHFVSRLTERDRRARLGSQRGVAEVLSHGFAAVRAVRLLRLPVGDVSGVARLRDFVRQQRLPPPDRLARLLRAPLTER